MPEKELDKPESPDWFNLSLVSASIVWLSPVAFYTDYYQKLCYRYYLKFEKCYYLKFKKKLFSSWNAFCPQKSPALHIKLWVLAAVEVESSSPQIDVHGECFCQFVCSAAESSAYILTLFPDDCFAGSNLQQGRHVVVMSHILQSLI